MVMDGVRWSAVDDLALPPDGMIYALGCRVHEAQRNLQDSVKQIWLLETPFPPSREP